MSTNTRDVNQHMRRQQHTPAASVYIYIYSLENGIGMHANILYQHAAMQHQYVYVARRMGFGIRTHQHEWLLARHSHREDVSLIQQPGKGRNAAAIAKYYLVRCKGESKHGGGVASAKHVKHQACGQRHCRQPKQPQYKRKGQHKLGRRFKLRENQEQHCSPKIDPREQPVLVFRELAPQNPSSKRANDVADTDHGDCSWRHPIRQPFVAAVHRQMGVDKDNVKATAKKTEHQENERRGTKAILNSLH